MPAGNKDEAPGRRVSWKIARVYGIYRLEVRRVVAIDVALNDLFERCAGCLQAQFHLVKNDFRLPLYRYALDLARCGVIRRLLGYIDQVFMPDDRRDRNAPRLD